MLRGLCLITLISACLHVTWPSFLCPLDLPLPFLLRTPVIRVKVHPKSRMISPQDPSLTEKAKTLFPNKVSRVRTWTHPTTATWEQEDTCQWSPFVLSCEEQLFPLLSIACQVGECPGPLSGCQQAVRKLPCALWCQQLANSWCPSFACFWGEPVQLCWARGGGRC